MKNNIPRTGRVGRFAKIVEKEVNQAALLRIMQDAHVYGSFRPDKKAVWWMGAIERLEKEIGQQATVEIMRACGSRCCSQGHRKTAKRLMAASSSNQEFLGKIPGVKEGIVEYHFTDDKTIVGHVHRCVCGQVKHTKTQFPNTTYCHCSAQFHKHFFEAAFEKLVNVEITRSIISGAKSCEFVIHINS
jgi:predicted hydrocarbon binding protein